MNKKAFFLECVKLELYRSRIWCLRATSLPNNMQENPERFFPNNDGSKWYFYNDTQELVTIEGADPKAPLFSRGERFVLEPGEFPGVTEKTETRYVQALINAILFVWPFEVEIPYQTGKINGKRADKIIAELAEKGEITVEEYRRRWAKACGHIKCFTQTMVTAATPRSISPSPEAIKMRDKLLIKYKDQLDDPAVLADIDQTISAIDREFIKGDESERFFLKGKQIDTVRKKLFHIQGGVPRLDDPTRMELLPNSLDEGMTPENMAAAVNNLRSGSYGRAKDTALGGEAAKFATRAFQNVRITSEDCGTVVGEPTYITSDHVEELTGMFLIGEDEPLTEARIKSLIGKNVYLRVPATCNEKQRNYCRRCVGLRIADSGIGIGALMNQTGNVFMSVSLAAFHGSSLKTTRLTREKGFKKIFRVL